MTQSIAIAALLVYLAAPTLTSVATDGLIQHELLLPILNFDRFHQPRLFGSALVPLVFVTGGAPGPGDTQDAA